MITLSRKLQKTVKTAVNLEIKAFSHEQLIAQCHWGNGDLMNVTDYIWKHQCIRVALFPKVNWAVTMKSREKFWLVPGSEYNLSLLTINTYFACYFHETSTRLNGKYDCFLLFYTCLFRNVPLCNH